ncbi:unnamed protein product, partial [Closterium sp. NIES-54]
LGTHLYLPQPLHLPPHRSAPTCTCARRARVSSSWLVSITPPTCPPGCPISPTSRPHSSPSFSLGCSNKHCPTTPTAAAAPAPAIPAPSPASTPVRFPQSSSTTGLHGLTKSASL